MVTQKFKKLLEISSFQAQNQRNSFSR